MLSLCEKVTKADWKLIRKGLMGSYSFYKNSGDHRKVRKGSLRLLKSRPEVLKRKIDCSLINETKICLSCRFSGQTSIFIRQDPMKCVPGDDEQRLRGPHPNQLPIGKDTCK